MFEQAKRGTPETSECTYQKELKKVTSHLKKKKRLFCFSIVFLVVQSDRCYFREHEHFATTRICEKLGVNREFAFFLEKMFFHLSRCPASSLAWPPKFGRLRRRNLRNRKATMLSSRMQLRLNPNIHSFTRLSTMKLLYVTLSFPFLATFAIW